MSLKKIKRILSEIKSVLNDDIHQYNISQGKVKIIDKQKVIGEININIINSKYKN